MAKSSRDSGKVEGVQYAITRTQHVYSLTDGADAALLQQAEVNALPCANQYDLGILRQWLKHLSGGAGFLCGLEAAPWREGNEDDLVAVSTSLRENLDVITRLTAEKLVPWLHKKGTHRWRVGPPSIYLSYFRLTLLYRLPSPVTKR